MRKLIFILVFCPMLGKSQTATNVLGTTGNVGIGTVNPIYTLQVNGSLYQSGYFYMGSPTDYSELRASHINVNAKLFNTINTSTQGGTFNIGDYNTEIGNGAHLSIFNAYGSGNLWVGLGLNYFTRVFHSGQTGNGLYEWTILGN